MPHTWESLFADALLLKDMELVTRDRQRVALTMQEAVVLGVLAQARGEWKSRQTLASAIYGGQWVESWATIVKQNIGNLRDKTEGMSFTIESDPHHRNLGYRLTGDIRVVT